MFSFEQAPVSGSRLKHCRDFLLGGTMACILCLWILKEISTMHHLTYLYKESLMRLNSFYFRMHYSSKVSSPLGIGRIDGRADHIDHGLSHIGL